jgi:predicted nucleic acid-binding Zn ribbon protein
LKKTLKKQKLGLIVENSNVVDLNSDASEPDLSTVVIEKVIELDEKGDCGDALERKKQKRKRKKKGMLLFYVTDFSTS